MPAPTILFLQGLPGPSSRLIAGEFQRRGARVLRINCNGGDWFDWRGGGRCYRGPLEQFGDWLARLLIAEKIRAIVLFGAERPHHRAASAAARGQGIDLFVLEEGYLRPNSVTLEHWPRGVAWAWPASLDECRTRAAETARPAEVAIPGHFFPRMRQSITYWLAAVPLRPLFRHYRSHRPHHSFFEMLAWNRRWARAFGERRKSRQALDRVKGARFFLLPLQIDGDAQLVHRSPFGGMAEALEAAITDFVAHAPSDCHLLVKRHPLDPDLAGWRRITERLAARDPLGRIHFIEHGDLDQLLESCAGVVTVNSTVGTLALARGRPVHVLGRAIYGLDGLCDTAPLSRFWHDPQPPQPGAYDCLAAMLWSECLLNAGFHSREGLARLAPLAADRILAKLA